MTRPKRILRLTGSYRRKEGVTEEQFHHFMSTDHAVKSAKIHERYGILKYQLVSGRRLFICLKEDVLPTELFVPQAFNTDSVRTLVKSLQLPWPIYDRHDAIIEYYFEDIAALIGISADEDFKALHVDTVPFIDFDSTIISLTWIEVFLDNAKVVNVSADGKSLHAPFGESSKIELSDKAAEKYY